MSRTHPLIVIVLLMGLAVALSAALAPVTAVLAVTELEKTDCTGEPRPAPCHEPARVCSPRWWRRRRGRPSAPDHTAAPRPDGWGL